MVGIGIGVGLSWSEHLVSVSVSGGYTHLTIKMAIGKNSKPQATTNHHNLLLLITAKELRFIFVKLTWSLSDDGCTNGSALCS